MKRTLSVLLFLFILLAFQDTLIAQTDSINYENLYQEQKETNKQLVTIIYSTLGVTVTLVVLFLGASFFYTTRVNKKELQLEVNALKEETESELLELIEGKFNTKSEYIEIRIKEVLDEERRRISKDIDLLKNNLKDNKRELNYQAADIHLLNAYHWNYKEVYENSTTEYIKAILKLLECNGHYDLLLEEFIQVFEKTEKVESFDMELYHQLLESLPPSYNTKKERINDHLKRVT